jgi:hypothetical protein
MPEIKAHKEELLKLLRMKSGAAPSPTHQKDVFGRWVDLAGLHGVAMRSQTEQTGGLWPRSAAPMLVFTDGAGPGSASVR